MKHGVPSINKVIFININTTLYFGTVIIGDLSSLLKIPNQANVFKSQTS